MRLLWILALGLMALPAWAEPSTWGPEALSELREKAQIKKRPGGVTASFFVSAPQARVYQILTDHPHLPEFMPNLDSCRIRREGPGWAEVEMRNSKGTMVLRRVFDPPKQIRWRLVEGTMLKRVDGSWKLDPVSGGTVLTYDSEVEASVPVPSFIIDFIQNDSLNAMISNVRQRIDSDGAWVKPEFRRGTP